MVRVLIDTNIIIPREDVREVPGNIQELLRVLNETKHSVLVHPLSFEEIKKDKNTERKDIVLSKLQTYLVIESPPQFEKDNEFKSLLGEAKSNHDIVDNSLLYCIYKDAVDFLITEDLGIHEKAKRIGISDRVFTVSEANKYFNREKETGTVRPPPLKEVPVHNLDLRDSIFDSLKRDYYDFEEWWRKISREGRKAFVHFVNGKIGAILILKEEDEAIDSNPPLPKKKRLKICTLLVDQIDRGIKIGELFIKISVQRAKLRNIGEMYLTHFTKPNDYLTNLITEFGFRVAAKKGEEDVYVKRLYLDDDTCVPSPHRIYREFYPSFYDGSTVNKYIVPIRPEWHNRLFTEYRKRQHTLEEMAGDFIIEGNTIKKAYLCHSKIKGMKEGDILLFYRSVDLRGITSVGVVENVYDGVRDSDRIVSYVGKRSVYSRYEIEKISKKPTKIILFWWIEHFEQPIKYSDLSQKGILKTPPRTIVKISHENYLKIKKGAINDRYTVNKA
jgi:predicted nucleic acid-binding protein